MKIRKTKIICTIGPSVDSLDMIKELMLNGMDCARVNFSHGDYQSKGEMIAKIKQAREELDLSIPILMDTKGPEIRIGMLKNGSITLKKGATFILNHDREEDGDENEVYVTYKDFYKELSVGTAILIDDGKIELKVTKIDKRKVITEVVIGGVLTNRKSINVPSVNIAMPYLSEIDKNDIAFAVSQDIDYIAASFTRKKEDVLQLKEYLKTLGADDVKIICKIENTEGVKNVDDIIKIADGIMVARGDLGVEILFEEIPRIQKKIISKCIKAGKIVITATQMLESMITNARPTRAEVSDVANAVYDGTSAIMLSAETASGMYPIKAIQCMSKIALVAEENEEYIKMLDRNDLDIQKNIIDTTCLAACYAADYINASVIAVVTRSGRTAAYISDFRPKCPILSLTVSDKARRQLNLRYGVIPVKKDLQHSLEELSKSAMDAMVKRKMAKKGDIAIMIIGSQLPFGHPSDTVRVIEIQ